jgi:Na+/H+ antiporter NhaA
MRGGRIHRQIMRGLRVLMLMRARVPVLMRVFTVIVLAVAVAMDAMIMVAQQPRAHDVDD